MTTDGKTMDYRGGQSPSPEANAPFLGASTRRILFDAYNPDVESYPMSPEMFVNMVDYLASVGTFDVYKHPNYDVVFIVHENLFDTSGDDDAKQVHQFSTQRTPGLMKAGSDFAKFALEHISPKLIATVPHPALGEAMERMGWVFLDYRVVQQIRNDDDDDGEDRDIIFGVYKLTKDTLIFT